MGETRFPYGRQYVPVELYERLEASTEAIERMCDRLASQEPTACALWRNLAAANRKALNIAHRGAQADLYVALEVALEPCERGEICPVCDEQPHRDECIAVAALQRARGEG